MLLRQALFLLLTLVTSGLLHAQVWKKSPVEAFGGLSGFHYFGDIGGAAGVNTLFGLLDINFTKIRPGVHAGIRYRVAKPLQFKAYYSTGFMAQHDEGSRNATRRFGFFSYTNELSLVAEFYIIPESDQNYFYSIMQIRGGIRHFRQPWSLYVFAGGGGLYNIVWPRDKLIGNPSFVGGGQFMAVIPFGVGTKFAIIPKISVGTELGLKYTFSDFLDGLTRPTSQYNDIYYTFQLNLNYKLNYAVKRNIGIPKRKKFFF